ncbi:GDSL-type esterase/lipase family protein [Arcticibacter sp.]|uniref:GDSL-type esterase/lipase family protein n=1 Tax=Arcticibacter sp. TaxID=1872630 RepID=UPI00388FDBCC
MSKFLYKLIGVMNVAMLCSFYAKGQNLIDSSYLTNQYSLRLDYFRKMPDRKNEIVFLGNSLTEGGKWQEMIKNKNVVNRGISGDVTYGIIARLDEVVSSKPAKIFLLCGINDMKRGISNEVILGNFSQIIQMIRAASPKTQLYIQSLLPVNEKMLPVAYAEINNSKINDLNRNLEALCKEKDAAYVNLHPVLADENGSLRKELCIDGLHLRQATYILWTDYLNKNGFLK